MVEYWKKEVIVELADNPPFDRDTLELAYRIREWQYLRMDADAAIDMYLDPEKRMALTEEELNIAVDDLVESYKECEDCNIAFNDMWDELVQNYFE